MASGNKTFPATTLLTALEMVAAILEAERIEYFVFFGTLLGIYREGVPINADDDVDIYVPHLNRDLLVAALEKNGMVVDLDAWPNLTESFLRSSLNIGSDAIPIDFYFFEEDEQKKILIDRWNYFGRPDLKLLSMHVPAEWVYPIEAWQIGKAMVNMPQKSEEICKYLYGESWNKKSQKNKDYKMMIINHRPKLSSSKSLIKIFRLFTYMYSKQNSLKKKLIGIINA